MAWLRLTAPNGENSVLINMNEVSSISPELNGQSTQFYLVRGDSCIFVKESLDEIEIMLRAKGEDMRRSDPRGREVIGQQHPDFQSPDNGFNQRGI